MFWTKCPSDYVCDKCLSVEFEKENDIACLNQKWPGNSCIYEGFFKNEPGSRVAISSQQCVIDGALDDIQVHVTLNYIFTWSTLVWSVEHENL